MIQRITKYFSNPNKLVILNISLLIIAITGNSFFQVYCIPTFWTIIVFTICLLTTAFFPIISRIKTILPIISFINGLSFFIFIYSVLFLEELNFLWIIGVLFYGIGLLILIPYFFIFQLIWKNLIKPITHSTRLYFFIGFIIAISCSAFFGYQYKQAITEIQNFESVGYQKLEKSYMTERILGMHFIYHTRFCEYDGWRPPKHDPTLIIGMWLNNRIDPLNVSLEKRLELYKKFYPKNKVKFDCSCAFEYRKDYHSDKLWKE